MHMINKKDLNYAGMDTLTKLCVPTIVTMANGEVQMHEKTIVYVKELDIFLTMKVLENTPEALSLCFGWKRILLRKINGQNHISVKNWIRIICNTANFVPIVVPGLSSSSSESSSTSQTPLKQESPFLMIFFIFIFFTHSK